MALKNNYVDGRDPSVTNSNNGSSSGYSTVESTNATNNTGVTASSVGSGTPNAKNDYPNTNPATGGSMDEFQAFVTQGDPDTVSEYLAQYGQHVSPEEVSQMQEQYRQEFHYNGNDTFFGWLTGKNKRQYEEAYNNWLAHRDDYFLDRNKDAYERNGLNYASLAGSTTTNSLSGSTPTYEDPASALGGLASTAMGLATDGLSTGVELMLGKEKVAGQKISNALASAGIPKAKFDSAVYSMLGDKDSQNVLHSLQQSFQNASQSSDNEGLKLANEQLSLFVQNLEESQGVSFDENGKPNGLSNIGQSYVNKHNRYVQGNIDFDYNQAVRDYNSESMATNLGKQQFELDKAKRDDAYEYQFLHAMQQAEFQMKQKLSNEQLNQLKSGNFFYDAVMSNEELDDKQKASILLAHETAPKLGGKLLNAARGVSNQLGGPMGTISKFILGL